MELAAPLKEARTFSPQAYLAKVGPERRLHSLAGAVFTQKQGRLTDRTVEGQKFRASGLNLVTAAIVYGTRSTWAARSSTSGLPAMPRQKISSLTSRRSVGAISALRTTNSGASRAARPTPSCRYDPTSVSTLPPSHVHALSVLAPAVSQTLRCPPVQAGYSFDEFQVTLGYAQQETDAWGRTSGDIIAHISPGSAKDQNTPAAFASFSQGRFNEARYAYLSFDLDQYTLLPPVFGVAGFSLSDTFVCLYTAVVLPLTEQIGLGNNSLVRGYSLDDGAFDPGVVSRNELRTPSFALLGRTTRAVDRLSPYVFFDAGYGKDRTTKTDAAPLSTGLGADYPRTPT